MASGLHHRESTGSPPSSTHSSFWESSRRVFSEEDVSICHSFLQQHSYCLVDKTDRDSALRELAFQQAGDTKGRPDNDNSKIMTTIRADAH